MKLALVLALVGCAPEGDGGEAAAPLGCEVGTGYDAFEPLEEGDPVDIIAGPQGGYHVFTSVHCEGVYVDVLEVAGALRHASTDEWLGPGFIFAREVAPVDGVVEILGLLNLLNDPEAARDQEVLVSAGVTAGETTAVDARHVVAR